MNKHEGLIKKLLCLTGFAAIIACIAAAITYLVRSRHDGCCCDDDLFDEDFLDFDDEDEDEDLEDSEDGYADDKDFVKE